MSKKNPCKSQAEWNRHGWLVFVAYFSVSAPLHFNLQHYLSSPNRFLSSKSFLCTFHAHFSLWDVSASPRSRYLDPEWSHEAHSETVGPTKQQMSNSRFHSKDVIFRPRIHSLRSGHPTGKETQQLIDVCVWASVLVMPLNRHRNRFPLSPQSPCLFWRR